MYGRMPIYLLKLFTGLHTLLLTTKHNPTTSYSLTTSADQLCSVTRRCLIVLNALGDPLRYAPDIYLRTFYLYIYISVM